MANGENTPETKTITVNGKTVYLKLFKGETRTSAKKDKDGNETEPGKTLATWSCWGPSDEDNVKDKDANFSAWDEANLVVDVITTSGKKDTAKVSNFDTWYYGMTLKANQVGRKAADLEMEVKDHILLFKNNKTVDLDGDAYKTPATLVDAINKINSAVAMGMELNKSNAAKLAHKIEQAKAAGIINEAPDGTFAVSKNGKK